MRANFCTEFRAVLPANELAAYEALWDAQTASVKTVSEQLSKYQLPSECLKDPQIFERYMTALQAKFNHTFPFEISFAQKKDFPQKLFDASHPLPFLYYRGAWDLIYVSSIAVVGTRNPTEKGKIRAAKLTKGLVEAGYAIISGLAKGIDTVAHETAIALGGKTIAVIGTPITEYYPKENKALQNLIATQHLLVSQVPILRYDHQDYRMNRFFFPERNKTMSAISEATVIVEAGETSGTLTQAREALKQKRKLYILANNFENPNLTWPKRFEEMGAIRVNTLSDILNSLKS